MRAAVGKTAPDAAPLDLDEEILLSKDVRPAVATDWGDRRARPVAGEAAALESVSEFGRYAACSVLALAVDMAVLLAGAALFHYLLAASLGFVVGALTNYLLATRWAFRRRRFAERRRQEFSIFVAVGIAGLGLNDLLIFLAVDFLAFGLVAAKLAAAAITFLFNYAIRKIVLF